MTTDLFQADWGWLAYSCALEAHEYHFSARFGTFLVQDEDDPEDEGILVLFNNNPYIHYPLLREREIAEIRRLLLAAGIAELAYATYPQGGPSDGYTYAMVIDASGDREQFVGELIVAAMSFCWDRRDS